MGIQSQLNCRRTSVLDQNVCCTVLTVFVLLSLHNTLEFVTKTVIHVIFPEYEDQAVVDEVRVDEVRELFLCDQASSAILLKAGDQCVPL